MRATVLALLVSSSAFSVDSTCYGTVSHGRLENGAQIPLYGPNFNPYSALGPTLGRTYVHSKVRDIVVAAYSALQTTAPDKVFVYGETGWSSGGRIRPHRTHQNGTSVDFFVPVQDKGGRSVLIPTSALNKYGYNIEFDDQARYEGLTIDLRP
jgi:penicillin-insensitive murein endopeptidase